jgi:serine/threonine protein kinase/WD40 repeat protein
MKSNGRDPTELQADGQEPAFEALVERLDRLWAAEPRGVDPGSNGLLCTGTRIGKYAIQRCIGQGSFGIVYLARDTELARDVALKFPRIEVLLDAEKRRRFHREATAAAAFDHPLIVPTYEAQLEGPLPYIASAYCAGPDLSAWLAQRTNEVDPRDAAGLAAQVADALQFAHDRGIVHRDIKPGNILLAAGSGIQSDRADLRDLVPRLTDFGLAKLCEASLDETRASLLIGTPLYMAPEQMGPTNGAVGPATDIYALGVILYELLCGQTPFSGGSYFEVLDGIRETDPPSPNKLRPDVPRDLAVICLKCLSKNPSERYASAAELSADLRRYLCDLPIHARPASLANRVSKFSRRHRTLVRAAILCCVLLTIVLAVSVVTINRSRTHAISALDETAELLYTADMTAAYRTWEKSWSDEVRQILDRHRPRAGEPDRRGLEWHLLSDLVRPPESIVLSGHRGAVNEISVFPDHERLASVGDDGTLRIWNADSGEQLACTQLTADALHSVAVAPDGRFVAAGSTTLYLVDLAAPGNAKELLHREETIESLCFKPDGQTLAAATRYNGVFLVTVDGQLINHMAGNARARTLQYLPQIRKFLVPNRNDSIRGVGTIELWDEHLTHQERRYSTFTGPFAGVVSIAKASPCEKFVAATDEYDPRTHFFERDTGLRIASTRNARDQSRDLDYASDGNSIAVGYRNGIVERYRLYPRGSAQLEIDDRPLVIKAHGGEVRCVRFVDAQTLATCGEDGRIVVWSLNSIDKEVALALDESRPVGFELSPDANLLFYSSNADLLVANLATQEILFRTRIPDGAYYPDWAPGGDQIAVRMGFENAVTILDRSGTKVHIVPHEFPPEDIAYSPAGDILATIDDQYLQLFSVSDGSSIHKMRLPGKGKVLAFSRDGRFLAYGGQFGRIGVMELPSYEVKLQLECQSEAKSLQFSPDDSTLATAHEDSSFLLWDLETGRLRRTLDGHERPVHDIEFSPDGRTLLSASIDHAIRLWSVKYGRSYGVLHRGDSRLINYADARLSLSKDGRRLAVCIRRQETQPAVLIQDVTTHAGDNNQVPSR